VQFEKTDYSYRNFWYNNNPSAGASFNGDWIYAYCSANGISRERCCVPGSGIDCKATVNPFESFFTDNNKNPQNPSEQAVQNLYWTYSIAPLTDNKNFLKTNKAYYLSALNKNVADFITEQGTEGSVVANSNLGKVLQYAQRTGWVMAGTLYYVISQQNNANLRDAVPDIGVAGAVNLLNSPLLTQYRQNYDAAGKLLEAARDQATPGPGEETGGSQRSKMPSSLGPQSAAIGEAMNSVASTFQQTTEAGASGGTHINPLVQLQQAGYAMLLIASVLYITLVLVTFVVGLGGNISIFALGFGAVNPLGPAAILIYFILAPMIFGLLSVLIGVGGMLGVYVPLIPYIIFTLGVIGWFMSTIETMVAGPLVALGILAPGGQHEILGKAEPALMLLFSLFLRPSLMIFGLMAAMLLSVVVVAMINSGFGLVITTIGSLGTTTTFAVDAKGNIYSEGGAAALANPLEVILFLCAYVTLIVTALNKCFSAIHVIPEKVMRWLGAQGEAYGEAEGMREVKGGVEAGEAGGKGAVKGQEQRAEKREIRAAGESKNTGMKVGDVKDARKKKE